MCRDSYLFSEVCDGLLHLQNKVLEVIRPRYLRALTGRGRGIARMLSVFPDAARGGEKPPTHLSMSHVATGAPPAPRTPPRSRLYLGVPPEPASPVGSSSW